MKKLIPNSENSQKRIGAMKALFVLGFIFCTSLIAASDSYVSEENGADFFPLVVEGQAASLFVSSEDFTGVLKVTHHLQADIERVSGKAPKILTDEAVSGDAVVIIGTIGKSPVIDQLIRNNKINADAVAGKWDTYALQTVENPLPGVDQALVIFGSDKRGTIYGIYDLATKIGVSPWYWWADVPAQAKEEIFIQPGFYTDGEPKVKYRGIFINDESPALRYWAKEKFGGLNHKFYEKVYELLLRNKANYLWPAMWLPTAFSDDDPENPRLADEYGIVISTSHHEPMMRAHDEWRRFEGDAWNYETNKEQLQDFWRGGVERMKDYETVVTVGMRGDGDEGMSEEAAVDTLKTIISDQRDILADVTQKAAEDIPQVWAIYKEVQEYYDKGMRVDDDILVLLCDDNWGNIRFLPKKEDTATGKAKFGMYYHFDYVGAPVSYKWHDVTQIERVWEQMKLTYEWGVKDLWIVNVGDIKPMEFPISFFLDFAWDPESMSAEKLPEYYVTWAEQQFGGEYAAEIAETLVLYSKYNSRRTPEMLKPDTYSLKNYREADRVVGEYKSLLEASTAIYKKLPEAYKSAFYQLVHSPIEMCCNLNEMYLAAGKNKLYGEQGRASANVYADKVRALFDRDTELTREFHEDLEDGKWNHMMSQTHIGYTHWNHPPANMMPAVSYIKTLKEATLGFIIEHGSEPAWMGFSVEGEGLFSKSFSTFDPINDQHYYIDLYNRGDRSLNYAISSEDEWISISSNEGTIQYDFKVDVSINWDLLPEGTKSGEVLITSGEAEYTVTVPVLQNLPSVSGFIENNGVVSIEAAHFTAKTEGKEVKWTTIPNLGRTHSAITTEPMNYDKLPLNKNTPKVEYEFTVFKDGNLFIETYLSPTQDYQKKGGLKFAIAIDDEEPQIININEGEIKPDFKYADWWLQSVGDNIKKSLSSHNNIQAGTHTLKLWVLEPGIVIQKFVINSGGLKPSYLGPPESLFVEP